MNTKVIELIEQACDALFDMHVPVEIEIPEDQFGDLSTNVAMRLAGQLKRNPREVAQEIATELHKATEVFSDVGVAGPGFINMRLHDAHLLNSLGKSDVNVYSDQKILVEYSDPNPFKPLHAGHLYTTLVGDSIARIVEYAGADTVRINYGGDVGLHVAKSMWAIIRHLGGENPAALFDIPEAERAQWLGARYVEGNSAYEDNELQKKEIVEVNKRVYGLHVSNDTESEFAQLYWTCREWSYEFFKNLYGDLQVQPFDRYIPESEVTPLGQQTVIDQTEKGVYERSDQAVIFDGEKHGLHTRVFINSEGLPTYEAKDVGLSLTKWNDYQFDSSIIITANEQAQYMQVVIESIRQFAPEPADRTRHLTHGVVKLQGGVKMSSRLGNVVTADDIIAAAVEAGKTNGAEQYSVVLAAIKHAFLKNKIGSDIAYSPEDSIAMEGNSGPYLQYAHARASSILRKSSTHPKLEVDVLDQAERLFVKKMTEFQSVLEKAAQELAPSYICAYIYELSQEFNRFYERSKVIGDEREALRIGLVKTYVDILKTGLGLLGIHAPEEM